MRTRGINEAGKRGNLEMKSRGVGMGRFMYGGWRMEDGGWRMEDGGWRMEDGGWRMEDGGME